MPYNKSHANLIRSFSTLPVQNSFPDRYSHHVCPPTYWDLCGTKRCPNRAVDLSTTYTSSNLYLCTISTAALIKCSPCVTDAMFSKSFMITLPLQPECVPLFCIYKVINIKYLVFGTILWMFTFVRKYWSYSHTIDCLSTSIDAVNVLCIDTKCAIKQLTRPCALGQYCGTFVIVNSYCWTRLLIAASVYTIHIVMV